MNKHIALLALTIASTPHKLQLLILDTVSLVLVMHTVNTESIHTNIGIQRFNLLGMTERIDTPTNCRTNAKLVIDKLRSESHFIDNILIGGSSLIRHDPSSEIELELTIFHKFMDQSLRSFVLLFPPALEESLFHISNHYMDPSSVRKLSLRIESKSTNNGIENITNLLLVRIIEQGGYLHIVLV